MSSAYQEIFDPKTGEVKKVIKKLPWVNKFWAAMTDDDKAFLKEHLNGKWDNPAQLLGYKKYLHAHCGVPKDFLGLEALDCG